jgi:hypothetical protein
MLAVQDRQLMAERNDLKLQFRPAAKPGCKPTEERRDVCEHVADTMASALKTLTVSSLWDFQQRQGTTNISQSRIMARIPVT